MAIAKININISKSNTFNNGGWSTNEIIQIMSSLPPNTTVVGFEQLPVTALAIRWNILVENPMFEQDGQIIAQYVRDIGFVDGHLIQFNAFVGLDLNDALGKEKIDHG